MKSKQVKTQPCSVIVDERLRDLAMIFIHWKISVDSDEVIKRMAGKKKQIF